MKQKAYLTFPQHLIKEPLIYLVGHQFKVVTNIRYANITDEIGLAALEFEGEASEIEAAMMFLKEKGVRVESVAMDVVE